MLHVKKVLRLEFLTSHLFTLLTVGENIIQNIFKMSLYFCEMKTFRYEIHTQYYDVCGWVGFNFLMTFCMWQFETFINLIRVLTKMFVYTSVSTYVWHFLWWWVGLKRNVIMMFETKKYQ